MSMHLDYSIDDAYDITSITVLFISGFYKLMIIMTHSSFLNVVDQLWWREGKSQWLHGFSVGKMMKCLNCWVTSSLYNVYTYNNCCTCYFICIDHCKYTSDFPTSLYVIVASHLLHKWLYVTIVNKPQTFHNRHTL